MPLPCGFLNINKPAGITSRDVVNRIQRLVRPAKVGHAGTLDPLATGVLVVAVGPATRLISEVQAGRKLYRGTFRLGLQSDTDDITGQVLREQSAAHIRRDDVLALLPGYLGKIQQVPPQFSAVHVAGERAYDLARRGESVELAARPVQVDRLELLSFEHTLAEHPEFRLEVECGGGTYIRSIGRDLGWQLGCGAVMTTLERLAVGPFSITEAIDVDSLTRENCQEQLLPVMTALARLPKWMVTTDEIISIRQGKLQRFPRETDELRIVLTDFHGAYIAMADWDQERSAWQPKLVFPAE